MQLKLFYFYENIPTTVVVVHVRRRVVQIRRKQTSIRTIVPITTRPGTKRDATHRETPYIKKYLAKNSYCQGKSPDTPYKAL